MIALVEKKLKVREINNKCNIRTTKSDRLFIYIIIYSLYFYMLFSNRIYEF